MALIQYKDVITTLAGCWFVRIFTHNEKDLKFFIKLCLYTVAFGSLLKVVLFTYSIATGTSSTDLIGSIRRVFGVQLMTTDFEGMGGRIQYISDTMIPICLFVILRLRKKLDIRSLSSILVFALLICSSLMTFSRSLWGSSLLGAGLGYSGSQRIECISCT